MSIDRIEGRSDIKEGETLFYQHRKKSAIVFLRKGDKVKVVDSSNQKAPKGTLTVVSDHLEEVKVKTEDGENYVLTGIHHPPNNLEGPSTWLRTSERKSAGRVVSFEVVSLEGRNEGFLFGEDR